MGPSPALDRTRRHGVVPPRIGDGGPASSLRWAPHPGETMAGSNGIAILAPSAVRSANRAVA
jgi:hypothetical protein